MLSRLDWDSDFFGLNIGKLVLSGEDDLLKPDIDGFVDYDLVYIFANHGHNMPVIGANLVDCKVIYKKSISCQVEAKSNIVVFSENRPSSDLYELALQSGEYSRFRLDDKMPAGSYEKLYRRWMEQSVADKVKSVYAVDVSAGMIAKARNANRYSNVEFDVVSSDSDFGENRFTKIYTCWVLQHVSDKEIGSYLDKFYTALKLGGRMVILEQVRLNQSRQSESMIQRMEDDYKKLFGKSGFNFIESHKVFRVPSYAMDIWKKYKLPKMFLPMLGFIEKITVMRKPEYIEYVSAVMVFEKMHK